MDNLAKCMIQCKKDGYGCHYGACRAAQGGVFLMKEDTIPEGWKKCEYCGKLFKPYNKQKHCELHCQERAAYDRYKKRKIQKSMCKEVGRVDAQAVGE